MLVRLHGFFAGGLNIQFAFGVYYGSVPVTADNASLVIILAATSSTWLELTNFILEGRRGRDSLQCLRRLAKDVSREAHRGFSPTLGCSDEC